MPDWTGQAFDYPHALILGDTYRPLVSAQLLDDTGVAYDLTGVTGVARIRSEPGGVVYLTPTVVVDAGTDTFYWHSTAAEVAAAAALQLVRKAELYLRLTWPSGVKKTIIRGAVIIEPDGAS